MTWGGQSVKSGMSGISTGGRLSTVVLPRSSKTSGLQPGSENTVSQHSTVAVQQCTHQSQFPLVCFFSLCSYTLWTQRRGGEYRSTFNHLCMSGLGTRLVFLIVHRSERLEVYCEQKLMNINGKNLQCNQCTSLLPKCH